MDCVLKKWYFVQINFDGGEIELHGHNAEKREEEADYTARQLYNAIRYRIVTRERRDDEMDSRPGQITGWTYFRKHVLGIDTPESREAVGDTTSIMYRNMKTNDFDSIKVNIGKSGTVQPFNTPFFRKDRVV
jgi:hypothetical protein